MHGIHHCQTQKLTTREQTKTTKIYSLRARHHQLYQNSIATWLELRVAPKAHSIGIQGGMLCMQDTDDMDYLLPQSITELGNCLMQLAATLIFVSIVQPIFLAGGPPCLPSSGHTLQPLLTLLSTSNLGAMQPSGIVSVAAFAQWTGCMLC